MNYNEPNQKDIPLVEDGTTRVLCPKCEHLMKYDKDYGRYFCTHCTFASSPINHEQFIANYLNDRKKK